MQDKKRQQEDKKAVSKSFNFKMEKRLQKLKKKSEDFRWRYREGLDCKIIGANCPFKEKKIIALRLGEKESQDVAKTGLWQKD